MYVGLQPLLAHIHTEYVPQTMQVAESAEDYVRRDGL
jgi:hypothetical protein